MFAKSLQLKDINNSSITGAMPFAGGPINSFVLHSTAKLISKIREDQKGIGIITGVSGMMTKQSYALWSKNPVIDFIHKDFTNEANSIDKPVELSNDVNGDGTIIGYTVLKKNISKAVIYLDTSDNKRKLITSSDKSIIESMENEEWVGKSTLQKKSISFITLFLLVASYPADDVLKNIDKHKQKFEIVANEIWEYAELDIKS